MSVEGEPPATDAPAASIAPPVAAAPLAPSPAAALAATLDPSLADNVPVETGDDKLPGEWIRLNSGFRIKWPPGLKIDDDAAKRPPSMRKKLGGKNQERVHFMVSIYHTPGQSQEANVALIPLAIRAGKLGGTPPPANAQFVRLNGMLMVKTAKIHSQPSAFGNKTVMLRLTEYMYCEGGDQVSLAVHNPAEHDAAGHDALLPYLRTFERDPEAKSGK